MVITAAWSEQPHGDILTHTSAHTTLAARQWRAAASASATAFSVVSVRLSSPSWTDALCEDDASLSLWLARLSLSPASSLSTVYYGCSFVPRPSVFHTLSLCFATSLGFFHALRARVRARVRVGSNGTTTTTTTTTSVPAGNPCE